MMAGALRQLPRSGEWLLWIERLFGCILLSLARVLRRTPVAGDAAAVAGAGRSIGMSGVLPAASSIAPAARVRYFPVIRSAIGVGMIAVAAAVWLACRPRQQAIAWERYEEWSRRPRRRASRC